MDGVLIQPPSVSSIPRLRTKAHGIFSHGSHFPPHKANLKILWDLSPRQAYLSADTWPGPYYPCCTWVTLSILTFSWCNEGHAHRTHTEGVYSSYTRTHPHMVSVNHRLTTGFCCSPLKTNISQFPCLPVSYYSSFLFSAWSPLPPLPSQLSFVLLLWDMAFFSFQSLFRLNNTIFYFSGKYYIFFLETIPSLLSVCSAKDWELIQTEPSRSCYIEYEMAPNIPELWKPKWAWYLP